MGSSQPRSWQVRRLIRSPGLRLWVLGEPVEFAVNNLFISLFHPHKSVRKMRCYALATFAAIDGESTRRDRCIHLFE